MAEGRARLRLRLKRGRRTRPIAHSADLMLSRSARHSRSTYRPTIPRNADRIRKFADSSLAGTGFENSVPRYRRWSRGSPKYAIRAERVASEFVSTHFRGANLDFDFQLTGCGSKALSLVCRHSGDRPVRTGCARIDAAGRRRGGGNGGAPAHGVELVGLPARDCPRYRLERSGPASGPACDP